MQLLFDSTRHSERRNGEGIIGGYRAQERDDDIIVMVKQSTLTEVSTLWNVDNPEILNFSLMRNIAAGKCSRSR